MFLSMSQYILYNSTFDRFLELLKITSVFRPFGLLLKPYTNGVHVERPYCSHEGDQLKIQEF